MSYKDFNTAKFTAYRASILGVKVSQFLSVCFDTNVVSLADIEHSYKKLRSTFKKSCYRPCSQCSKTAKIKRERKREGDSGNSSSYEAYNTIA
jgi:hypothetical protein